ncbi:lipoprotein [Herminiimonas fonticola]|uniref:LPS translocon maturation chaperone LptM n=1 Tax=Herminiimonas fonticola TaxID=303380 RepID=UPI003342B481
MKSHSGLSRFVAFFATLAGALCISLLAGCGQKGPLYMPQGQQGYGLPPVQSTGTAPASSAPTNTAPAGSSDSK